MTSINPWSDGVRPAGADIAAVKAKTDLISAGVAPDVSDILAAIKLLTDYLPYFVYGMRNITPTIPAAWQTNPTALANINDTDLTNVTGTGTVLGSSDNKNLSFDLLSYVYINIISVKASVSVDSFGVYIGMSAPAYTAGVPNNMTLVGTVSGTLAYQIKVQAVARYVVLSFHSAAGNQDYAVQYLIL